MKKSTAAFTLIELLVVITIIAILAGIAVPVFNGVTTRANQTKDLANAKQVALALKLFSGDNYANPDAGTGAITTSNMAFRELFPNYITSETVFYLAGSTWTPKPPDNVYDLKPVGGVYTKTLQPGENNFAYVTNLTDTSNPSFPLIADGFNTIAKYSTDKTQNHEGRPDPAGAAANNQHRRNGKYFRCCWNRSGLARRGQFNSRSRIVPSPSASRTENQILRPSALF